MQKCHSMRKIEINCYTVFGWIWHLVEVRGKTDHHEYVNILQQHVLELSVDFLIIKNQISLPNWTMPLTDRVTGFPAWYLEFPPGPVTWIFRRYEYNRHGNGMHYAQIEERATFECFITLSLCPTGLGEITQGYCEVLTHVCLTSGRTSPCASPHNKMFDGMWIRIIVHGCSSIMSIANTFHE